MATACTLHPGRGRQERPGRRSSSQHGTLQQLTTTLLSTLSISFVFFLEGRGLAFYPLLRIQNGTPGIRCIYRQVGGCCCRCEPSTYAILFTRTLPPPYLLPSLGTGSRTTTRRTTSSCWTCRTLLTTRAIEMFWSATFLQKRCFQTC